MALSRRSFLKAASSLAILPAVKITEAQPKTPVMMLSGDIIHGTIYPRHHFITGNHEWSSVSPQGIMFEHIIKTRDRKRLP